MKIIDCGISGSSSPPDLPGWEGMAQVEAITTGGLLTNRRNLIVSAPTNSGKSLIGHLFCLQAIKAGKRAVLLEPLRAIAQEKFEELSELAPELSKLLGMELKVTISTGDYRLEEEMMSDPAPEVGEFLIATPERFEAILRNPENNGWLEGFGAICLDEAHLIAKPPRGAVMEGVLTTMMCLSSPPRICLLSATLGNTEKAMEWLDPCDLVHVQGRFPPLEKRLIELEGEEEANEVISGLIEDILNDEHNQVVVFVYQTKAAEKLAKDLTTKLGEKAGEDGCLAFHSRISTAQKASVRNAYSSGKSRCVVATTSLAMGVNLPASHVILRDAVFFGAGELDTGEMLQMLGRAGRGNRSGAGLVVLKPSDGLDPASLSDRLKNEELADFRSSHEVENFRFGKGESGNAFQKFGRQVAGELSRRQKEGCTLDELNTFFDRSLGGKHIRENLSQTLCELRAGELAINSDDNKHYLTTLGKISVKSTLPLAISAGIGQLVRDVLDTDEKNELFGQWTVMDCLLLLCFFEGGDDIQKFLPQRFNKELPGKVDAWFESSSIKSALFNNWIRNGEEACEMLFGSMQVKLGKSKDEPNRKHAYLSAYRAIIILEMGQGKLVSDLERRWKISGLEGIQEKWRDQMIWLLGGLARVLELPCFFRHLKDSDASDDRIKEVKVLLAKMRSRTYHVMEILNYCSPLGPIIRSLRRSSNGNGPLPGKKTLEKLAENGITTLQDIVDKGEKGLVDIGIRRNLAKVLLTYSLRRLRS